MHISHVSFDATASEFLTSTLIQTLPLLTQLLGSLVSSFPGQVLKIQSNLSPLATLFFSQVEETAGTLPAPQQAAIAALLQS